MAVQRFAARIGGGAGQLLGQVLPSGVCLHALLKNKPSSCLLTAGSYQHFSVDDTKEDRR